VAVKVSTLAYGVEDLRFEKEARVLAQLAHPNIVPIHAKGIDAQGRPFYSMKLIKGWTLRAVLNAIREGIRRPAVLLPTIGRVDFGAANHEPFNRVKRGRVPADAEPPMRHSCLNLPACNQVLPN
jgi:hypothetical protein